LPDTRHGVNRYCHVNAIDKNYVLRHFMAADMGEQRIIRYIGIFVGYIAVS
jgi:hypothetical protein